MSPDTLFASLWNDYITRLCPSAQKVHDLLQEDEVLINDHIALRTFGVAPLGIETLAKPFLELGYKAAGDYVFESKKLVAKHFEHPDPKQPKVFISELEDTHVSLFLCLSIDRRNAKISNSYFIS